MGTSLDDWLAELRRDLITHFKPELLGRPKTVFNFEFDTEAPFHLVVKDNAFAFEKGIHGSPTITLYVTDHHTLKGLLTGSTDGMNAFMLKQYRADGNIVLSQLLLYLFKSDRPTIAYEVRD